MTMGGDDGCWFQVVLVYLAEDVLAVIGRVDDKSFFGLIIIGEIAVGLKLTKGEGDDSEHD